MMICKRNFQLLFFVSFPLFQILVANDKACRLLGCSSQELIGQNLSRFISKCNQETWEAVDDEYLETDECTSMVSGTVVCEIFEQISLTVCNICGASGGFGFFDSLSLIS